MSSTTAYKASVRITWDAANTEATEFIQTAFAFQAPFAYLTGENPATSSAREAAWGTASEPKLGTVSVEAGLCQFDCDEQAPLVILKKLDSKFPNANFRMLEISEAGLHVDPPVEAMGFAMKPDGDVEVSCIYAPAPGPTEEVWRVIKKAIDYQVSQNRQKPRGFA